MLTEFSIGNYQAFSESQRVPLKPITLVFGPNSAGKSSLLRSLLVAQHAILRNKLSKSEGAGERHPGSYADMVRGGNSRPIEFGFTVQPDGKSGGESLDLELAWKENPSGVIETETLSLKQKQSEVVTYSVKRNLKHLHIKSMGDELGQIMTGARLDTDAKGSLAESIQSSIKKRLCLQKNAAIPGSDTDHFRVEDDKDEAYDILGWLEEALENLEKTSEKVSGEFFHNWRQKLERAVNSLKEKMTSKINVVDAAVRDALTELIYHGPIRPICDEITKARKSEPGIMEWWNLAADPGLLDKVNSWLKSDVFKTKYQLEFDRLFPDSSLADLLKSLSGEYEFEEILDAAFEYKLNNDDSFYDSQIDTVLDWFMDNTLGYYENEDDREKAARDEAYGAVSDESRERGVEYYYSLYEDSNIEEMESFVLGGVNLILGNLRGALESVRQRGGKKTPGSFDSAKVQFRELTSNCSVTPSNMGIGFSQMMPLVASAFGSENRLIAIEQPELHIHPALQTELGDLFIQSVKERGNRFLIETHSEHLILRLLRRIRETTEGELPEDKLALTPDQICVLYVEPGDNGSKLIELPVTADGDFSVPWPGGFFAERTKELF